MSVAEAKEARMDVSSSDSSVAVERRGVCRFVAGVLIHYI
jgi:hypothetical protein